MAHQAKDEVVCLLAAASKVGKVTVAKVKGSSGDLMATLAGTVVRRHLEGLRGAG